MAEFRHNDSDHYSLYNPLPGWFYRLESDWLMHENLPLAICANRSRPIEYRWELWKCLDLYNGDVSDRILGFFPRCVDAMMAVEEWKVVLYPYAYVPPKPRPPSQWEQMGRQIRRILTGE